VKAIEAFDLTRDFQSRRAVNRISFNVYPGEIFGFLGPNGAGKTTTIKMLTGQLRPTHGTAKVAGWDIVHQRKQMQSCIGVVFEHQNIYDRLTARDNMIFTARLYGASRKRVDEVLQMVGLADRANEKVQKFSNGMKQRLMIARALLPDPDVIFLDEPTKGLDPQVSRAIRCMVLGLSGQGVAIFLTTHYMEEAQYLCNRVAILNQGKIVALDKPVNIIKQHGSIDSSLEDIFIHLTGNKIANLS
jgi:ABC-2 type transport system ATP-binding protein